MAFINYAGETEEERRRRLEQEAAAAAMSDEAVASGGAAPSAFGSYFNNRLGAVEDRMAQATEYLTDPAAAFERRMAQQQEAADTEVQSQTVKTYGDGSQERTVKTQMPAPTTGPAVPEMMPQPAAPVAQAPVAQAPVAPAVPGQEQRPQVFPAFAQAVQQNQARPAQPVAPAIPPEMADQAVAMPPMPQPGPPVQVASADAAAGLQAAAAARAQQQAQQVATQAPAATPSLQQLASTAFAPTVERELQQPMTRADQDQMAIVTARNEEDPERRRQAFAQLLGNPEVSEGNKSLANKFIAEDYLKQINIAKAEKQIAEATPTDLARYMKEQKKEGSYIKAILLARLGLNELAAKEQELINPTIRAETAVVGDQKYTVFKDKRDKITEAFDMNGRSVNQETIARISAGAMPTKSFLLPQSAGGLMQKTITGPDGQPQVITGQVFTDPIAKNTYFQAGNTRYDTSGLSTPAQNIQNVYGAAGAKQQATQAAQTGQPQGALPPLTLGGGATPAAAATTADPAAVARLDRSIAEADRQIASASKSTAVSPERKAQQLQVLNDERNKLLAQRQSIGGVATPTAASVQKPGEPFTAYQERLKRESAVAEAAAKEKIQTSESIPREFIKLNTKAASDAAAASANAPQLISTIDRISRTLEQRPDFANSLQSPAFTAFVVAQETEKQKRLEDLSNAARIRPQDKTEFQNLVNDLRKLEVAGITQSGLTASQLNTERESQRVVDALAANLRNTPQAARTQVEIARAQILYNQRFARYLASADPTKNPALLRSQFDDTIGDKIYSDLVPKLEAISRGGVVDFRSKP